jgi:hypothetical protein
MTDKVIEGIIAILTAVVGLAIISVLVSKNAQTGSVLSAGASGFSSILSAATAPVSGNSLGGLPSLGGINGIGG